MGGLEHFFARAVHDGLGLIYYIIEATSTSTTTTASNAGGDEREWSTSLMEDALEVSVKRHPLLRAIIAGE